MAQVQIFSSKRQSAPCWDKPCNYCDGAVPEEHIHIAKGMLVFGTCSEGCAMQLVKMWQGDVDNIVLQEHTEL